MEDYQVKVAEPTDHIQLSEIAVESKRHWGYPEEWIQGWMEDLTISPDYINMNYVFKLIEFKGQSICGFCALDLSTDKSELEVAHLWLKPTYIGRNLGKYLLESSLEELRDIPIKAIRVTADPNALGFYEKFGFVQVGHTESTPPGRLLPNMVLKRS